MKRLNKRNIMEIKCKHGICKSCVDIIWYSNNKPSIFSCPLCRREYTSIGVDYLHPIICKVVFKNNIECGLSGASDLFFIRIDII